MFHIENNQTQILHKPAININILLLLEKPSKEFCDKLFSLNQLEKQDLRFDLDYCPLIHKNGVL